MTDRLEIDGIGSSEIYEYESWKNNIKPWNEYDPLNALIDIPILVWAHWTQQMCILIQCESGNPLL